MTDFLDGSHNPEICGEVWAATSDSELRCTSTWPCPSCREKISERAREQTREHLEAAIRLRTEAMGRQGRELIVAHTPADKPDALLEAMRRAHAEMAELQKSDGPSYLERHGVVMPQTLAPGTIPRITEERDRALHSLRLLVQQLTTIGGYSDHESQCQLRAARMLLAELDSK